MTTTEPVASDVAQWVAKLDAMTADDIADLLRAEKVTGLIGFSFDCPIANFLRRQGNVPHIQVGAALVTWWESVTVPDAPSDHHNFGVPISGGIRRFVTRFDDGAYPDLCRFGRTRTDPLIFEQLISSGAPTKINTLEISTVGNPA